MTVNITLQHACDADNTPVLETITRWVDATVPDNTHNYALCIRFVSPSESAELNARFRQKNSPTNILSFDYDIPSDIDMHEHLLGDIVLCPDLIEAEAQDDGIELQAHYAHLIIHGVLHLLGYDHMNDNDATRMQQAEIALLRQFDIEDPYES